MSSLGLLTGGTISVSNDATAVTGSGTAFTQAFVGSLLIANGEVAVVSDIASDTALTISDGWAGTTISGGDYAIVLISQAHSLSAQNQKRLQELLEQFSFRGALLTGTGAPDTGDGYNGDVYIDTDTATFYSKASDSWSNLNLGIDTAVTAAEAAQTAAEAAQTAAETAQTGAETAETNAGAAQTAAEAAQTAAEAAQTGAETAETNAGTAQTAAEAARDAAQAAFDDFDDIYLGAKASDPTVDNDGDPLAAGMLYYNTTDDELHLYTGSAWVGAVVAGSGFLTASNNLSDLGNAATARVNIGTETGATGALIVPAGTTAQRPGSPAVGYFRWNTTTGSAEVWDGSAWGEIAGAGTSDDISNESGVTGSTVTDALDQLDTDKANLAGASFTGGVDVTDTLTIEGVSNPELRIAENGSLTSYTRLADNSTSQVVLQKVCASGESLIDLNPLPSDGTSRAWFRFFRDTNTFGDRTVNIYRGNGTGTQAFTFNAHNGVAQFSDLGAGTLQTDASGSISASSDERLKTDIASYAAGLNEILQINPITYRWSEQSGFDQLNLYAGFSAQNVDAAMPEAVGIDGHGYLTINDRPIIAALVNAVKTLKSENNDLRSRVEALEAM